MFNDIIIKWLYLTTKTNISRQKLLLLYNRFGSADGILSASLNELKELNILNDAQINVIYNFQNFNQNAFKFLLGVDSLKIVTIECSDYPDMLRSLPNPPLVLYCRGKFIDLNKYLCIACVGTRNPTPYGQKMTYTIVQGLAKSGCLVVSGLAQGVDAISHMAAIDAGFSTVAFVASGVDIVYPKVNRKVYDAIVKNGMIVSEYPPGTMPKTYYFPERNRLVSGVSKGIFLSEAKEKSGSAITCSYALGQGKDIFALPGNADSPFSYEPNRLIKNGAMLVTDHSDITCHYSELYYGNMQLGLNLKGEGKMQTPSFEETPQTEEKPKGFDFPFGISNEEKVILTLKEGPLSIDAIAHFTSIPLSELDMLLLTMEMDGKIKLNNGNYFNLQ